ncbi:hypothetical protein EBM89_10420 [Cellulomonas triticagri]|uniref:Uncharacterized protein n=1 Tax=Cellulomonas triticagri TaxID=2483352 RepID=A0A3M2J5K0_9CELL|nr:hypothetical protein EBM89_10420 [Cellulomonas triticagri]
MPATWPEVRARATCSSGPCGALTPPPRRPGRQQTTGTRHPADRTRTAAGTSPATGGRARCQPRGRPSTSTPRSTGRRRRLPCIRRRCRSPARRRPAVPRARPRVRRA